jgi:hypothetical protein
MSIIKEQPEDSTLTKDVIYQVQESWEFLKRKDPNYKDRLASTLYDKIVMDCIPRRKHHQVLLTSSSAELTDVSSSSYTYDFEGGCDHQQQSHVHHECPTKCPTSPTPTKNTATTFKDPFLKIKTRVTINMIDKIVNHLVDGVDEDLLDELQTLGKIHSTYNVRCEDYIVIGEAILHALSKQLQMWNITMQNAWNEFYSFLVDTMMIGEDNESSFTPNNKHSKEETFLKFRIDSTEFETYGGNDDEEESLYYDEEEDNEDEGHGLAAASIPDIIQIDTSSRTSSSGSSWSSCSSGWDGIVATVL